MQEADRVEFRRMLGELFGALDKPLTEAKEQGFWTALSRMSLVEFGRCRDHLLRGLEDGEQRKNFSVSDVWGAKRTLRASAPDLAPVSTERPDYWLEYGNRKLLEHIRRLTVEKLKSFGKPLTFAAMRMDERRLREGGLDKSNLDASTEFVASVQRLVMAKNSWVRDMKDLDLGEGVETRIQKDVWADYMARAHAVATA